MLKLSKLRDLNLTGTSAHRPDYVYAASGLVQLRDDLIVVADDELHLAIFPTDSSTPGRWLRLFPGELSLDYEQRKKEKPDLEAITYLPPDMFAKRGALLVVPSMSRAKRIRGALILIDDQSGFRQPIPIDFLALRRELSERIVELNIEGVALGEGTIRFFHRGSHGAGKSAVIEMDRQRFARDLHDTHSPAASSIMRIREYDLGTLKGVNLAFTDAVGLRDGRTLFLASAENSKNAYDDGAFFGSVVGLINADGDIASVAQIEGKLKLEGVSVREEPGRLSLSIVSDSDDEKVAAGLFASTWPQ